MLPNKGLVYLSDEADKKEVDTVIGWKDIAAVIREANADMVSFIEALDVHMKSDYRVAEFIMEISQMKDKEKEAVRQILCEEIQKKCSPEHIHPRNEKENGCRQWCR